ncbi:MAG: hypothetical protein KA746_15185 [Pyrinomonadaceae bacterium]|nr:hypothetical protein [Pyrinomonadaceae bacterium]
MKVVHDIGERWKPEQVKALETFGISVSEDVFSYVRVDSAQFELINEILMSYHPVHALGAEFDRIDLDRANWLGLTALAPFGYPQPQETFDFVDVYDTLHRCLKCGMNRGGQKSPFRIKSDKTRFQAFQLGWIFDEIFVKRELYEEVFLPLGIKFLPVVIHRSGEMSELVVQLDLPMSSWLFDMSGMRFELCSQCGQKKYVVLPLDFLPPLKGEPPNQIFRGQEYFGSDASANRRIYLTQDLRQELLRRKIAKWFQFYPLENPGPYIESCI